MKKWLWFCFIWTNPGFLSQYYKTKNMVEDVKNKIKDKPVKLMTPEIDPQFIEILEYGDNYVIVKSSTFLGLKHCFYKAIEFFNSKYDSFLLKMGSEIHTEQNFIIVKFIAYDIQ